MVVDSKKDQHQIRSFYSSSVILITGGTGFLGKVLVEKLLRTFDPKKIFLLVRKKNSTSAKERLKVMFDDPVNEKIKRKTSGR